MEESGTTAIARRLLKSEREETARIDIAQTLLLICQPIPAIFFLNEFIQFLQSRACQKHLNNWVGRKEFLVLCPKDVVYGQE
jgi:hypothetical protein